MASQKKQIPWNKGKKLNYTVWNKGLTKFSDERIMKYANKISPEWRRIHGLKFGFQPKVPRAPHKIDCQCFRCIGPTYKNHSTFGKGMSEDTKRKIGLITSKAMKGKHNSPKTEFTTEKIKGEKNNRWKGGITPENLKIRNSPVYRNWIKSVFKRDNWTCQKYKIRGSIKLVAHHIENFNDIIDKRFNIDNGITLSDKAHREFHKKYGRINNTKKQLNEFLWK